MSEEFTPHNTLEERLAEAQAGHLAGEVFMQELLVSQVFLPVQDDHSGIANFQSSDRAVPLTLDTEEGGKVLILFTSPERARDYLTRHPGYGGGLLVEFKWVLERMGGSDHGIAINPGWEVGLDMESDMVQMLARQADTAPDA